jgi:fluoride exporter
MPVAVAVAIGGALGAVSRYGIDRMIQRRSLAAFPWSTFLINISGCLAIGVAAAALADRPDTPAWLRTGLTMGVIGGYTTFSTFGKEALDLMEEGRAALALAYVGGSVCLGILAVFAGMRVGRVL